MPRLEYPAYLAHIRHDSARFRDVLATCDPTAAVPSCPDWSAADLLWHLTTVQHWWCAMMTNRPQTPDEMGYVEPPRPDGYDALLAMYDEAHAAFIAAIETADPAEPAYSWSSKQSDHTVAFTYRRQAHEALIHRIDAELTTGALTALDPALAADGVDEALDVMYGHLPSWGKFDPLPHFIEFRMTDAGASVWTQIGIFSGTAPDGEVYADEPDMHAVPAPDRPADVLVVGEAPDLDAWLWHRRGDAGIAVTGDPTVYEHVRGVLGNPIN